MDALSHRPLRLAAILSLTLAAACSDSPLDPVPVRPAPSPSLATAFTEDFNELSPARWTAETHPLGRGWLRAAHVTVAGGAARLALPASSFDGAEIRSTARYRFGTFEARLQTPRADGSVSAFFLYQGAPGDANDEIDIELFNDGSRRIMFTTWVQGVETNNVIQVLPFDPAAAAHDYRIEWSNRRVRFLVDGQVMQQFTRGVPKREMHLYANVWWPTWMSGPQLRETGPLVVDRIRASP